MCSIKKFNCHTLQLRIFSLRVTRKMKLLTFIWTQKNLIKNSLRNRTIDSRNFHCRISITFVRTKQAARGRNQNRLLNFILMTCCLAAMMRTGASYQLVYPLVTRPSLSPLVSSQSSPQHFLKEANSLILQIHLLIQVITGHSNFNSFLFTINS